MPVLSDVLAVDLMNKLSDIGCEMQDLESRGGGRRGREAGLWPGNGLRTR